MSVVRLFVLGVVRLRGQAHGYAVHRELGTWRIDTWTRVRPGSIYHSLKQLTKEGKLRALGVEESAEGPGRELFSLTREGEAEFLERLEAALSSFDLEELGAGVAFMTALPRTRVLALLRSQHQRATAACEGLEKMLPMFPQRAEPPHTADLLTLWTGSVAAVARFTEGLIARLEAGEYTMAGE
ncbi:PadR family transcriptional regulator [Archangium lipolyticum]|uniref:PadR family transcriptional regulator n=1 Tax=Archangium lipolyticum TaxID=2970465 RepID=UPI002149B965|nr:PadR family transcriptional regulator [Archangium lipolyticum]